MIKKYKLLKSDRTIIRVLEVKQDKVLIIDYFKRTMPTWIYITALDHCSNCSEDELRTASGAAIQDIDDMTTEQRKTMYERFTMVAPVLPFIADSAVRNQAIQSVSVEDQ